MNYSTHRITKSGHIELREKTGRGLHRSVIKPNQKLEKYNDIIEADPNYKKYRTEENAKAYEESLKPTQAEIEARERQKQREKKREQRKEKLRERPANSLPAVIEQLEEIKEVLKDKNIL